MSWVTIIWAMGAGASLTLAFVHLLFWLRQRQAWASLLFALMAASAAGLAWCEWSMLHAETTADYGVMLSWLHIVGWVIILSLVWVVRLSLRAGHPWLVWSVCVIRTLAVGINYLSTPNIYFKSITELRRIPFLGETVSIPVGETNPWVTLPQFSMLLLAIYAIHASVGAWRRGDRRLALTIGGSIIIFTTLIIIQANLILWGRVQMPPTIGLISVALVIAMGIELSLDMLRTAELAQALRVTESELNRQRLELSHIQRVASLGALSGSIAHEINQPLAIILTNAQAAQRLLAQEPADLAEVRDILDDIVCEDRRAGAVIRRMRSLLKRDEPRFQEVQFNDAVEGVLRLMRRELVDRRITVSLQLEKTLPPVLGDLVSLEQVMLNLISNACDAMAENPPEERRLTLSSWREGTKVRLSVSDNGCGLPTDKTLCFDPFFTTKAGGLGMGLPICLTILEAHGGRLWGEPNTRRGAVFHMEFPMAETVSPVDEAPAVSPEPA